MDARISVVIPTYNRAALLVRAIESVTSQTHPAHEIIVVDDGSTDDTCQALGRLLDAHPRAREATRYLSQSNQGQAVARNRGLQEASGEWIAFLDSDDEWLPDKLALQLRALRKFEPACLACFTDVRFKGGVNSASTVFELRGEQGREEMGAVPNSVKLVLDRQRTPPVWVQTVMTHTSLAREVGGFDPKLRFAEDDDFLFRLAGATGLCFVNRALTLVDRSPGEQRHTGPNVSWEKVDWKLRLNQYRYEKQLDIARGMPSDVQGMIRRDLRSTHSAWANWYLRDGNLEGAKRSAATALNYGWSSGVLAKYVLLHTIPGLAARIMDWKDKQ